MSKRAGRLKKKNGQKKVGKSFDELIKSRRAVQTSKPAKNLSNIIETEEWRQKVADC